MNIFKECLELFQHNPQEFLCRFISFNKTWSVVHHYTPVTKEQWKQWVEAGGSVLKMVPSAGSVLWCAWHNIHRLSWKRKNNNRRVLCSIIGLIEQQNLAEMTTFGKEESALLSGRCIHSQSAIAVENWMNYPTNHFAIHTYSPNLATLEHEKMGSLVKNL